VAAAGVPSTRGEAAVVVSLTGESTASARPTRPTGRRVREPGTRRLRRERGCPRQDRRRRAWRAQAPSRFVSSTILDERCAPPLGKARPRRAAVPFKRLGRGNPRDAVPSCSGTDGSNPIPSSSESGANLTSPPQAAGCIDYRVGGTATCQARRSRTASRRARAALARPSCSAACIGCGPSSSPR
jgi:hypothetical protein